MTDDHKMTIRLPKELHKAVKIKAIESDITLSEAIRKLLGGWVSGKVELPEEELPTDD
jgi:hypothetical protein